MASIRAVVSRAANIALVVLPSARSRVPVTLMAIAAALAGSATGALGASSATHDPDIQQIAQAESAMSTQPSFYDVAFGDRILRVPAQFLGRPFRHAEQVNSVVFCLSWPDGAVVTCQGSERSDRYDVVIHAIVRGRDAEHKVTAQQIISNRPLIRARSEESGLERFNVHGNNLEEYFLGRNAFGTEVLYMCDGEPNAIGRRGCKVANKNYVRDELGLGLFYYFSRKLLPHWRQIDAALWNIVESWERDARNQNSNIR